MSLPNVSVAFTNGGLGLVAGSDDGVVGLICSAASQPLAANTPIMLTNADDLSAVLSSSSSDEYAIFARKQITDFYLEAGRGAVLWFMVVSPSTPTASLFTSGVVATLLNAAQGKINVVAVSRFMSAADNTATPPTILNCLDADTLNAMDEAQAVGEDFATRHMPVRFLMDGKNLTVSLTGLRDLTTHSFNRVGVCVGSTDGSKYAALGLLLGRVAAIPVNQNVGRVKTGSVFTSAGSVTNAKTVEQFTDYLDTLHNSGYILLRKFINKAGYYWNDDHMVTSNTDDYFSLAHGRVVDKAARITYLTYVDELLDEVIVDEDTGKIVPTQLKMYQTKIERAITLQMKAEGEISGVSAFVDPTQDILATSTLNVELQIVPTGTNRAINVKLGLFNPNA